MLRKIITALLCSTVLVNSFTAVLADDDELPIIDAGGNQSEQTAAVGINVQYRTQDEIRQYVEANGPQYLKPAYTVQPDSVNAPYSAGVLSQETLDDGLKAVNTIRYIAGLNYNVTLNNSYNEMVQAGALVNAVNGNISHFPDKPAGIDEALYKLGYDGNGSANLAWGFGTLASAVTNAWLNDGDSYNIDVIGHRRWLLNAAMGKTGFGQVGTFTGMYAFDSSASNSFTSNVWPAQNTPVEFFDSEYPWSVSTGRSENIANVKVTMTNKATGTVYTFSQASADGFFNVDNDWYGVPGAVIWRPQNITYSDGDSYDVKITGLTNGNITYTVNFFQLYGEETMTLSTYNLVVGVGKTVELSVIFTPSSSTDYVRSWSMSYHGSKCYNFTNKEQDVFTVEGLSVGSGAVTLTSNNGLTATCNITVVDSSVPVTGVALSETSLNLKVGDSAQLNATVIPEDADNKKVTWNSSDSSVVTVDNTGSLTALRAGTAVITVTTEDGGYTASCAVTVESEPLLADLKLPSEAKAGEVSTLTAEASGGVAPYQYQFKAKIDGEWITIQKKSDNNECSFVFESGGDYPVSVIVTDSAGITAKSQKTLTVIDDAPVLPLSGELILPESAAAGEEVALKAQASGGEKPYKYQFKAKIGGEWITIQKKSDSDTCPYTFTESGKYPVIVLIYDHSNEVYKSQKTLTVRSAEPLTGNLILPENAVSGEPLTIKASASGGDGPYKYQFTAKINGKWVTIQKKSSSSQCSYTFETAGSYAVNVTVTDSLGITTKIQETLTVKDASAQPLTAGLTAEGDFLAGNPLVFKASAAGGDGNYSYKFTAKVNGEWIVIRKKGTGAECTWTFDNPGTYTVNVTVYDGTGDSVKYQIKITVK